MAICALGIAACHEERQGDEAGYEWLAALAERRPDIAAGAYAILAAPTPEDG